MPPSVVIIINALHSGGAEKTCVALVSALKDRCRFTVVALLGGGPAEHQLRALGVEVVLLEGGGLLRMCRAGVQLASLLRSARPAAVLTFLYISDVIGGVFARLFARPARVYWNIRNNVLTRNQTSLKSILAMRMSAWLSARVPHVVLYCSSTARAQHEQIGYRPRANAVVENSAANVAFRFDADARRAFRQRWSSDDFTFLFVGRFDPVKRVDTFLDACEQVLASRQAGVRFVIAGRDMDSSNTWLSDRVAASSRPNCFALMGFVDDQQALYSGADCLVVTSESEGSPNAVYEAIATGLPVIILATIGTESIVDEGVVRLPSRSLDGLSIAMLEQSVRPAMRSTAQSDQDSRLGARESAVVSYFRRVLLCG